MHEIETRMLADAARLLSRSRGVVQAADADSSGMRRPRRSRFAPGIVFAGGFGLITVYALRGGSYDIVPLEENAVVVWWVLGLGIVSGFLPRTRPAPVILVALAALLAYTIWSGLSLTWSESSERTTEAFARDVGYVGIFALIACAVDRDTWRPAVAGLGFGALLVCAIAVLSRLAPSVLPSDQVASALRSSRLSYPFGYWNAVGAWGAMSTAIGLSFSVGNRRGLVRAASLGLVPVAGAMTYLSYSRAGVAGTALAVLLAIGLSPHRIVALLHAAVAAAGTAMVVVAVRHAPQIANATGTKGAASVFGALAFAAAICAAAAALTSVVKADRWGIRGVARKPLTAACISVVVIAGGVAGPRLASRAWHSFRHPAAGTQSSNPAARVTNLSSDRYDLWKSAQQAFNAHPTAGIGAGNFELWWNRHPRSYEFVRDAHSLWFENLAELGLPGLMLIVAVAAGTLSVGIVVRRRARRPVSVGASAAMLASFGVYLLHASVDWMWQSAAVTVLAFAGVAALGVRLGRPVGSLPGILRIPLVLVAVAGIAVQIPGLLSTLEIRRSQRAESVGNANQALSWATDAISAEPWSASAYEQRALVYESGGRLSAAAADEQHAVSEEPTDFRHWLILARIQTERGQFSAAVADYNQANGLAPRSGAFAFASLFNQTR